MKFKDYINDIFSAGLSVDDIELDLIHDKISYAVREGLPVMLCGNGGSAAIADHFVCDLLKGIKHDCSRTTPNIISLVSNGPLLTALANDYDYGLVFAKQLSWHPSDDGVLIAISSSGNSLNILNALREAKYKGWKTIALVGFDGGKVLEHNMAHYTLHVKKNNYGIVEDTHSMIMHYIAQKIRMRLADNPNNVKL